MGEPLDDGVARVAEAIRRYLSEHPDAADSETGIAAWWLPAAGVQGTVAEVAVALDGLHREGAIERQTLPDGNVVYRALKPRGDGE